MKLELLNAYVLVEMDEGEERMGSFVVPHKYRMPKSSGTVVEVGRGELVEGGVVVPSQVKPGDRVLVLGNEFKAIDYNGKKIAVLPNETMILAKITEEESALVLN